MNAERSRRLIEFIKKHDDFSDKISLLIKQGWECKFVFSVLKGQPHANHSSSNRVREAEHIFSENDDYLKLKDFINVNVFDQIGIKKNREVYQYLDELRKLNCFENIKDVEEELNIYLDRIYKRRKNDEPDLKKEDLYLDIHWLIKLDYSLKDKSNNKIYNITNDNIDFVKQEFINRTKEALNLFGLDLL